MIPPGLRDLVEELREMPRLHAAGFVLYLLVVCWLMVDMMQRMTWPPSDLTILIYAALCVMLLLEHFIREPIDGVTDDDIPIMAASVMMDAADDEQDDSTGESDE